MAKKENQNVETKKVTKRRVTKKIEKEENQFEEENEKKPVIVSETKKEDKNKETNSKMKYTLRDVLLIMVLAIVFGVLLGRIITKHCSTKSIKELKEVDKVYNEIVENHYEELDDTSINSSLISGLIEGLNDKYAFYYNDKNGILTYNESINGYFIGLGVQIRANEDGTIEVISVYDGSPAKKSGMEVGDFIVKMNDDEYNSLNFYDLTYNIKSSKPGDKVKIEVLRNGESKNIEVVLEKVDVDSVSYTTREANGKNIGIITINNFANNTYDQFVKIYDELSNQNVKALVIDVRDNSEGKLENASKIVELFLGKDSTIYKLGKKEIKSKNERKVKIPVVVLINENTVSTGEMFASSLNENLNTPLVGTKTYGKGYMQEVLKLANGRYVMHTIEEWKTSKGELVEGIGITPTHDVKCIEEVCETDVQLEKAIELASSQSGLV